MDRGVSFSKFCWVLQQKKKKSGSNHTSLIYETGIAFSFELVLLHGDRRTRRLKVRQSKSKKAVSSVMTESSASHRGLWISDCTQPPFVVRLVRSCSKPLQFCSCITLLFTENWRNGKKQGDQQRFNLCV